jgi:hypothetical protein
MKGICFTEPCFRAVIEGRKIQTRRPAIRYETGEIIYLKEPYAYGCVLTDIGLVSTGRLLYRYDGDTIADFAYGDPAFGEWKSKQSMREKHARYFIEITASRYEPLQTISDEDCIREGCLHVETVHFGHANFSFDRKTWYSSPRQAYADLIDKMIKPGTWESNPNVWVYDFKLVK